MNLHNLCLDILEEVKVCSLGEKLGKGLNAFHQNHCAHTCAHKHTL